MAKELPYFQFEPAEYLTKDISFCSLSAQGLFANICSYYWQRGCILTKDKVLRRLNYPKEFNELVSEGVIDLEGDNIIIKFLDIQWEKATKLSKINRENGSKGGRPKKRKETEIKPKQNPIKSETKGIRKEENKIDEIIEEENKEIDFEKIFNSHFFIKISQFFAQTLQQHKERVASIIAHKIKDGTFSEFEAQTNAYIDYKRLTKEKAHQWQSYLTQWDETNWIDMLKNEEEKEKICAKKQKEKPKSRLDEFINS